jgi:SAM-dependent methyltransferase
VPGRSIEAAKERGWREIAAIDAALERGEIDEGGWHRAIAELIVPAYLAADNPRAQSGHSGDEERWKLARSLLLDGIDRDGTFLDVGCANGLLMESVHEWATEKGLSIEPYGLDISPELAELARSRVPHWADRIVVGNALGWEPRRRFDFVRTGLEYVPRHRRRELIQHLLHRVAVPGGRVIVGVFNEERQEHQAEKLVSGWGYEIAGRTERPHRDEWIAYRAFWIDAG